jgi:hypothetical protein
VKQYTNQKTILGGWLENRGLDEKWLVQRTNLSNVLVLRLLNDHSYLPSGLVIRKVYSALKENDPNLKISDVWNI